MRAMPNVVLLLASAMWISDTGAARADGCGSAAQTCGCAAQTCGCAARACRCQPTKKCTCVVERVHVHYVAKPKKKEKHGFGGPPPPFAPVLEYAAVRRVAAPLGRTRLRFEREVQQELGAAPERAPEPENEPTCGSDLTLRLLKELAKEPGAEREAACGSDVLGLVKLMAETQRVDQLNERAESLEVQLKKLSEQLDELSKLVTESGDN